MPEKKRKTTAKVASERVYKTAKAFQTFLGEHALATYTGAAAKFHTSGSIVHTSKVTFNGETEIHHVHSEHEQKRQMAVCREMYEHVGIVGNIVDLMVDFALEDIIIEHPSPRIQNLYRNWARQVDLRGFAEIFLKSYFRDGNVPILVQRGDLSEEQLSNLRRRLFAQDKKKQKKKKRRSSTYSKTFGQFQFEPKEVKPGRIPIRYRILNVMNLHKGGSSLLGTTFYQYMISRDEAGLMKNPKTEVHQQALKEFKKSLNIPDGDNLLDSRNRIVLQEDRLDVIHYKKDHWRAWATPMLWRISDDVRYKQLLRDMDISLAEGVTNALTIIKLGNSEKGFQPSKKAYNRMVDMMKNPAKDKTIVWDDMIEIVTVYPPTDKMLSDKKYAAINNDIRSGIGVPEVLVNGTGGNFANSFLSVKTLLERLKSARNILVEWIEVQFREIASALGIRRPAWIKLGTMTLNDEEVERRFLLELVDRNLMSSQTLIQRAGENFEIELQRMREEDKIRKDLREDDSRMALRKLGKFGPQIQGASLAEVLMMDDDDFLEDMMNDPSMMQPLGRGNPTGQEGEGQKGGSPRGRRGPRSKETQPRTPQGQQTSDSKLFASALGFKQRAAAQFDLLYNHLTSSILKVRSSEDLASLTAGDMNRVYMSIIRVICMLDGESRISKKQVAQVLKKEIVTEAGAKLDSCVRGVVKQKVTKFRKRNNKEPSSKQMKEFTSSGFAICKAQGLK